MNILLTGGSGQLGRELLGSLASMGQITGVDRVPGEPGSIELDLSDFGQVDELLDRVGPDIIVNAAAYTAVDQAENDERSAFRMNAELPACLARWCKGNDRLLLHYSTDYVFNGTSERPYQEVDVASPLGVYGASKLAGEWAVQASQCRHVILRTSWVYSSHGSNFVLSMLRLARQRSELSIVSDQTGCPTSAHNLAFASKAVLEKMARQPDEAVFQGIFHYSDRNVVSWYDFASLIFEQANELGLLHEIPRVKSIKSTEYPQTAKRPLYSVLDTGLIRQTFGIEMKNLETSLRVCLENLVS